MNITINLQEKKPALSREEVQANVEFAGATTPSRAKLVEAFAKKLDKDAKLVVVKEIKTQFGSASAKVVVYVYDKEEDMKKLEPAAKEEPKKEGAAAEPAKEEKPAEAPKEEPKKEEPAKEEAKPEEKKE